VRAAIKKQPINEYHQFRCSSVFLGTGYLTGSRRVLTVRTAAGTRWHRSNWRPQPYHGSASQPTSFASTSSLPSRSSHI